MVSWTHSVMWIMNGSWVRDSRKFENYTWKEILDFQTLSAFYFVLNEQKMSEKSARIMKPEIRYWTVNLARMWQKLRYFVVQPIVHHSWPVSPPTEWLLVTFWAAGTISLARCCIPPNISHTNHKYFTRSSILPLLLTSSNISFHQTFDFHWVPMILQ